MYNQYIAVILLFILGIKMIKDSFSNQEGLCPHHICLDINCGNTKCTKTGQYRILTFKLLLIYGIATSIDALAGGISFGLIYTEINLAVFFITLITLVLSYIGTVFGLKIKHLIGNNSNFIGGLILVFLAIKSLFF